jgi:hypothetical protein
MPVNEPTMSRKVLKEVSVREKERLGKEKLE